MSHFHRIVQTWFERRFGVPTEAQARGWPAIASGRHTLIAAPTGSGKTLAAFLTALDGLVRQGLEDGALASGTQVVYVSPLKALANDIQRNLLDPLAEITQLADEMGTPIPEIRVAVRTGDTPAKDRVLFVKRPPHVLITTPESLFILLTSERGRAPLKSVRTLILDELHAVVPNKRGSHLSLSVERLCRLAEQPVTRIGLSATQKPVEEVARFLVGGDADCAIVDVGHKRDMDLAIELPENFELGAVATHEQWAQTLDQIAKLVEAHRTTLLFVNTRRLVERVAQLGIDMGVMRSELRAVSSQLDRKVDAGDIDPSIRELNDAVKDAQVKLDSARDAAEESWDAANAELAGAIDRLRGTLNEPI